MSVLPHQPTILRASQSLRLVLLVFWPDLVLPKVLLLHSLIFGTFVKVFVIFVVTTRIVLGMVSFVSDSSS